MDPTLYDPILVGALWLLSVSLAGAIGAAIRLPSKRVTTAPLPLPAALTGATPSTHLHKFFPWTRLPNSEIADLERPDRCCNIQTSEQFCVICYHAPTCKRLKHT